MANTVGFIGGRVSGRCGFGDGTFAEAPGNDDVAPTADVCDKGVFWKSPLRPRTMLSLKEGRHSQLRDPTRLMRG